MPTLYYDTVLINSVFEDFSALTLDGTDKKVPIANLLSRHKEVIIAQAFFNLGLNPLQQLAAVNLAAFKQELKNILPVFGSLPTFISGGDALEYLAPNASDDEKLRLTAKNYLRLFMRGTSIGAANDWVWNSPLFTKELYETLANKGNPALLAHIRQQIQDYLNNAYNYIKMHAKECDIHEHVNEAHLNNQHAHFKKHLFPLLASLAFFDYPDHSNLVIPVLIDSKWQQVNYTIQKLDLSPAPSDKGLDGVIGYLLEDENRFYMYGLTPDDPIHKNAQPILLLNGTPHPGCPGEALAVIHNFGIKKSVGESHNWSAINNWVEKRENIVVYAHSKGGSMGQMLAAENPDKIYSVDALSAPALHSTTLERLRTSKYGENQLTWDERIQQNKINKAVKVPLVSIYHQSGDLVFYAEQGFLAGTEVFQVITNKPGPILNAYLIPAFFSHAWEGHSMPSLGYATAGFLKGNWEQENKRALRSVLDTAKGIQNYFITVQGKSVLILRLCAQKINRLIHQYKAVIAASVLYKFFTHPWYRSALPAAADSTQMALAQLQGTVSSQDALLSEVINTDTALPVGAVADAVSVPPTRPDLATAAITETMQMRPY
ncbi:MAG: hypothetical protein ACHP65_05805 [Legionellales bacterium]